LGGLSRSVPQLSGKKEGDGAGEPRVGGGGGPSSVRLTAPSRFHSSKYQ
jgi:hypothetical protein